MFSKDEMQFRSSKSNTCKGIHIKALIICFFIHFLKIILFVIQGKDEFNVNNSYNQNFTGIYCNCKRPYPDPDDTIDDEMIQCVICEDWFHKRVSCVPELKP